LQFAAPHSSFSHQLQDVVKQRLQVQKTSLGSAAADTVKYKGSLHCIKTIIKEEGFLALWTVPTLHLSLLSALCRLVCVCACVQGFLPALAVYCPFVGIYFMTYEQAKRVFQKTRGYASVDDLPLPYQLGTYRPRSQPQPVCGVRG
jgi:hypothetical protein